MTSTVRLTLAAVAAAAATALTSPGDAAATTAAFQSPSRNIGCIASDGALRCDIASTRAAFPFRRPARCPLEWGDALEMGVRGRPRGVCHGDTALGAGRVVAYGRTWRAGGFACTVRRTGVTCRNRAGHGWLMSRARIRVF
jgi:hypothetical protein